jgi:membrane associated rhomboid family serine protease
MQLKYYAPVVLTFALLASVVLVLDPFTGGSLMSWFTVYPELQPSSPIWYLRLFSHVVGHGDWDHLISNFTLILLVGPILEEKYGSRDLLIMMLFTALVTGLLQVFFFNTALLGASGIVFMLILLSSFANARGGIPLTFVLVVLLFLGREVFNAFAEDNVSQTAHIIGGVLGGIFGFVYEGRQLRRNSAAQR